MPSCICWNCDEDYANVIDGDRLGVVCMTCKEWFCSYTCLSEHEELIRIENALLREN